ncbi:HNH endonuclease signature motif containing protein [Gordonia malaquae]|uniref:HNH endonuclease signature motif containing protein n=1 Tax=Gordonia malaquae TaxID=410332 RepID=UPI0030FE4FC9
MNTTLADQAGATLTVEGGMFVVRMVMPDLAEGSDVTDAALMLFAARSDLFQGMVLWDQYEAIYRVYQRRLDQVCEEAGAFTNLYDPLCQVAASYATVRGVRQHTGEKFVDEAVSCMERVPAIGVLLRGGLLTPKQFRLALDQTAAVVDTDVLAVIDAEAADRLRGAGNLTGPRVTEIVAAVVAEHVAEHDADAAQAAREVAKPRKKVVVEPVDGTLADLRVTGSVEDVRLAQDSIDAVIAGVCPDDPRGKAVRRSDAVIALLTGKVFACQCAGDDCPSRAGVDGAARLATVVLHVVARRESLTGESDIPAYLDGFGPITAEHARDIAADTDTVVRDLDVTDLLGGASQPSNGYRPTAACDALVRAVHGRCTHPGCDMPAYRCDLDHVAEYNHDDPAAGGPTCPCNLNPKCRFHHGLKTFVNGWLDDQIVDANGVIWTETTTPEGITVRSRALNHWLLPELGLLPCVHHDAPTTSRPAAESDPGRPRTRTDAKHRYRMRMRAYNRRTRERPAGPSSAVETPPF